MAPAAIEGAVESTRKLTGPAAVVMPLFTSVVAPALIVMVCNTLFGKLAGSTVISRVCGSARAFADIQALPETGGSNTKSSAAIPAKLITSLKPI